jgi:hypothetical protein
MIIDDKIDLDNITDVLNNAIKDNIDNLTLSNEELLKFLSSKYDDFVYEEGRPLSYYKHILQERIASYCKKNAKYNSNDESLGEEEQSNILDLENKGDLICSSMLIDLSRHLVFYQKLKNKDLNIAINVTEKLHDFLGNAYYYENNNDVLMELFQLGVYLYLCDKKNANFRGREINTIIQAIKYLEYYLQIKYEIKQGDIILNDNTELQIHDKLEELISYIGGSTFLKMLYIEELFPTYNKLMDRYLIHRNKTTYSIHLPPERIPYNYLIQIGLKHLNLNTYIACLTKTGIRNIYDKIIEISCKYFTVLNLQSYSSYEDLFVKYKDLPAYIAKNMLFEKMLIPEQYKVSFILDILEYLYRPFFEEEKPRIYSFNDYMSVAKYILNKAIFCEIYSFDNIEEDLKINCQKLKAMFDDISIDKGEINSCFSHFLSKTNFRDKPLIKIENNKFMLLDPHFSGFAFCEVLYQMLKKRIKDLDSEQGHKIETFVYAILNKKKFSYKHGKYQVGTKNEGECDLILENDEYVIFIEMKKRPLPFSFELGDDISLYKVLAEGMLTAQKQALGHIIYLQNNDKINLSYESEGKIRQDIIELKNRRPIAISICLSEYLFLTNKVTSQRLLESLLFATYHARDIKREKELEKVNIVRKEIIELISAQNKGKKIKVNQIFHNTLFRSLQQFVVTLENSKDINTFISNLVQSIYVTDGSLDYYTQMVNSFKLSVAKN